MPESLLSFSAILLFGRKLDDLAIVANGISDPVVMADAVVFTKRDLPEAAADVRVKGIKIKDNQGVLVKHSKEDTKTGLKKLNNAAGTYSWIPGLSDGDEGMVRVEHPKKRHDEYWNMDQKSATESKVTRNKSVGRGNNTFVGDQLDEDACFARIYGFSYEGDYFDLPSPTLFLVHGDGELASQKGKEQSKDNPSNRSRAPRDPFNWRYGGSRFSICRTISGCGIMTRLTTPSEWTWRPVCSSRFCSTPRLVTADFGVSGAKVSGAKVSGAKVSGAKVSGAKVSGAKARGPGD